MSQRRYLPRTEEIEVASGVVILPVCHHLRPEPAPKAQRHAKHQQNQPYAQAAV
jgi:hypothetical protein